MPASRDSARVAAARDVFLRFVANDQANDAGAFERLCAEHPRIASELRASWAEWNARTSTARTPAPAARSPNELLAQLSSSRRPLAGREIARGGMGAIVEAWDGELNRLLAMKTMLAGAGGPTSSDALARFLEEAQVTGQLEHPGIVPVHQLGVDDRGRPFFTMRLVEGRDVRAIFALAWAGAEGWNETRALGVLQKVCEAMAYAHDKGVLHRDLKPANVMVGRFGEVYVMDWGVARVLGREDAHGLHRDVATVRSGDGAALLVTRDGDIVGTPAYMAPEQARGEVERLSPQSDIYSVGAMLYHLLAKHPPYLESARAAGSVLARALSGPPQPLSALDPPPRPELLAICERAMAREPRERYASMLDLADDLRAYLEGRVVHAYESGAWAELRKWVLRNKALASSLVAALLIAFAGIGRIAQVEAKRRREVEERNVEITKEKTRADQAAADALREAERARQEALTSERVLTFIDDMFRRANPGRALGTTVTVKSVLEDASARLSTELQGEPQVRARLLDSMGRAYLGLGLYDQAEPLLREALTTARQLRGTNDPAALAIQRRLASLYIAWRQFDRAEAELDALTEVHASAGTEHTSDGLETRLLRIVLDEQSGRLEVAERECRDLLAECAQRAPADERFARDVRSELARVLVAAGRGDDAAEQIEQLIDSERRALGDDAKEVLSLRTWLGRVAHDDEEYDLAERALRDVLEAQRRTLAPNDLTLAQTLHDLGFELLPQGEFVEALSVLREARDIYEHVLGERNARTLAAMADLGGALIEVQQEAEGTALLERVIATARTEPALSRVRSSALNALARSLVNGGELTRAEAAARERWEIAPEGSPDKAAALALLEEIRKRIRERDGARLDQR